MRANSSYGGPASQTAGSARSTSSRLMLSRSVALTVLMGSPCRMVGLLGRGQAAGAPLRDGPHGGGGGRDQDREQTDEEQEEEIEDRHGELTFPMWVLDCRSW